jgi:hypothetical protein
MITGEYLGKFETEFKNILGCHLGPRDNRLTKNRQKSRDTVPLRGLEMGSESSVGAPAQDR